MTFAHLVFIPAVFLVGLLSGFAVASHRSGGSTTGLTVSMKVQPVMLFSVLGLFLVTLIATHFAPIPGGVKDLHTTLAHQKLFDQSPSFSLEETYRRISGFGVAGRAAYQRFTFTTDLIFPITLLSFLLVLGRFVGERVVLAQVSRLILRAAPVLWFTSDLVENGMIYFLLSTYPAQHIVPATLLAYISVLKFALLLTSLALPLALYALASRRTVLPTVRIA